MGFTADHDYTHIPHGWNYRLADALASLILDSIGKRGQNVAARRAVEFNLNQACPEAWKMPYRVAPWVYDIRIPGMTRGMQKKVVADLQSNGVQARCGFKLMSEQEQYKYTTITNNPAAKTASDEVFYIPLTADIGSAEKARWVFRLINRALPALGDW